MEIIFYQGLERKEERDGNSHSFKGEKEKGKRGKETGEKDENIRKPSESTDAN